MLDADDDNDGVLDTVDDFPVDASASLDTDGDGAPDEFNQGKTAADSTSVPPLVEDDNDDNDSAPDATDAFPKDPTEQVDADNDGVGANADLDDNNAAIGASIEFTAANLALEYVQFIGGALADPNINLALVRNGERIQFFPGGARRISALGAESFTVAFANGLMTLTPQSNSPSNTWLQISDLAALGVIDAQLAADYIANNNNHFVNVDITEISSEWDMLSDTSTRDIFLERVTSSYHLTDDGMRTALRGDVNAAPVQIISDPETIYLDEANTVPNLGFSEAELLGNVIGMVNVVVGSPTSNEPDGLRADLVTFNPGGLGSNMLDGRQFNWQIDANGSLTIAYSDGSVLIHQKVQVFNEGWGVLTIAQDGQATFARYHFALPQSGSPRQLPIGQFMMSGGTLTNPGYRDQNNEVNRGDFFGFRFEADGKVTNIWDATVPPLNLGQVGDGWLRRYFTSSNGETEITVRQDRYRGWGVDCDIADDTCNRQRVRHWIELGGQGNRFWVLEWELWNDRSWEFPQQSEQFRLNFNPRINFYEPFELDIDNDGLPDATDPDRDGDNVANDQDLFPENPADSADDDGDGVGNNTDAYPQDPNEQSDNDQDNIPDGVDQDLDNDGISNTAEYVFGMNPFWPNDATEDWTVTVSPTLKRSTVRVIRTTMPKRPMRVWSSLFTRSSSLLNPLAVR